MGCFILSVFKISPLKTYANISQPSFPQDHDEQEPTALWHTGFAPQIARATTLLRASSDLVKHLQLYLLIETNRPRNQKLKEKNMYFQT